MNGKNNNGLRASSKKHASGHDREAEHVAAIGHLESLLSLKLEKKNQYSNTHHSENFQKTIYGGQVLAQALMAASQTVSDMPIHSMHAYFLQPGRSDQAVHYDVEHLRDGKSIASRRITASQDSGPIFHMTASFHQREQGFEHQAPAPDVQTVEALKAHSTLHNTPENTILRPFEFRPLDINQFGTNRIQSPETYFWFRAIDTLPEESHYHKAALAFVSDIGLLATALFPHPVQLFSNEMFGASIDHAMWFHDNDFNVNNWMLCVINSPWAGHARGFAQASIYQAGKLIASCCQEGIIRQALERS